MKFIQKILSGIFIIWALLLFILTMLLVLIPIWVISKLPEPKRAKALHKVFRLWMGVYLPLIFCPVTRKGKKNFKKGEQYVVVINHNAMMDIPVATPWIPGPNKTLAKIEMAKIPLFGLIYTTGSILVDRKKESSRRESFARMQETLDMGIHLCLYPEGTRNKTDKPLQPFYDGAFITAIKSQKDIIPGIIFNTGIILPHSGLLNTRPMPILIHFLKPISVKGLTLENVTELKNRVYGIMEQHYAAGYKSSKL